MTSLILEAKAMARKAATADDDPMGRLLTRNLYRLGFADIVVRSAEIARLVTEKTGRKMSRQRISQLTNAIWIEPDTVALLAKALGVKPSELLKKDGGD